jgi:hypothetical protein
VRDTYGQNSRYSRGVRYPSFAQVPESRYAVGFSFEGPRSRQSRTRRASLMRAGRGRAAWSACTSGVEPR